MDDVIRASHLAEAHQLSFWDAMVLVSAAQLGCEVIHTEDLNAGQLIDGVTISNPFASGSWTSVARSP